VRVRSPLHWPWNRLELPYAAAPAIELVLLWYVGAGAETSAAKDGSSKLLHVMPSESLNVGPDVGDRQANRYRAVPRGRAVRAMLKAPQAKQAAMHTAAMQTAAVHAACNVRSIMQCSKGHLTTKPLLHSRRTAVNLQ
jgi:hypothetical protein